MMRRLWPFAIGSVALGLDAYIVAGLLPLMAPDLSTSKAAAGLGVTAFTGAYAVCGPLVTARAGRSPRRGLTLALAVFAAANAATALAPGLVVYLLSRIVAGAAAGVYSPLSSAVAAALCPPERRGRALALVLAGLALGTVFGVPLGLLLADHLGWRVSIALVTLVGFVALLGVLRLGEDTLPPIPASSPRERLRTLTRATNLATVGVTFLTAVASLGLYTYITDVLSSSALAGHPRLGIWVWGLGGAIGALGIGRVLDRAGRPMLLSAIILIGLTLALLAATQPRPAGLVAVALALWGMFGWASLAPQQAVLLAANPQDGASAIATNASANYLGASAGSALAAVVVSQGAGASSLTLGAATVAGLALVLQLVRLRLR